MAGPNGRIDLRSDTVTRPTGQMRRAMADAEVGDDGFGDDPTVRRLEEAVAERLGKEAAVFVPSGTMANQIALRVLGVPGTAVLAGRRSHVAVREHGAAGPGQAVQLVGLDDDDGTVDPAEVARWIDDGAAGWIAPSALFVEDTHGEAGGRVWPLERLDALGGLGVPVHLDGARIWHASVASGVDPARRAAPATTVCACLSKGLGAPAGSLLAASADLVGAAREERKRLGGTMRQVGVLAAAGFVALGRVERLAEDHRRAARLAEGAAARWPGGLDVAAVETNIVRVQVPDPATVIAHLADHGVDALVADARSVRMVTHADVVDDDIAVVLEAIAGAP